jgi:hypothetical protein
MSTSQACSRSWSDARFLRRRSFVVGPNRRRFVHFVGRRREDGKLPPSPEEVLRSAELASLFRVKHFGATIAVKPVVAADFHRHVYSALQLLAMTDAEALAAAAASIRDRGLAPYTVPGQYGWRLDRVPVTRRPALIEAPRYFDQPEWFAMLEGSARAIHVS